LFNQYFRIMRNMLFGFLWLNAVVLLGQNPAEAEYYRRMDQGEELMLAGRYEEADEAFKFVMKNMKVLPTNLTYLFGRNSFHLGKYKQSINWLNKYIQLKGTQGQYHKDAVRYLKFAEDEYLNIQREATASLQEDLGPTEYDCGGLSKMICPVCRGDGVILKQTPFEIQYQTCPYCEGSGFLSCENYNLFMMGKFDPSASK
jgi:tetratricopeptide (TPR) repeat protein